MIQTILHRIFWIIVFMQGIFQLLEVSSVIYKVGMPLIIIILLAIQLMGKKGLNMPYIGIVFMLILITIISAINNSIGLFLYVYFFTFLILGYLYFVIIVNDNNIKRLKKILWTIIILYLIQIPVTIIKYFLIGQTEKGGIGTLSISGGSISTILPCFAIAIIFSLYYFKKDKKYILLIAAFFLFGIIGEKRAVILYIPFTIFMVYLISSIKSKSLLSHNSIKFFALVLFSAFMIFYLTVRLSPTLNPDNRIGGKFDFNYSTNYMMNYVDSTNKSFKEMRRKDSLIYFVSYLYKKDIITFLFGEGAGRLISTKYRTSGSDSNLMLDYYGIRYGGRTGFVWMYLQIGAFGILFYSLLIFKLFKFVWKNYKPNAMYLSFLVLTIIYILDFFTYSYVFFRQFYLSGVYFTIAALLYLDVKHEGFISKLIPNLTKAKHNRSHFHPQTYVCGIKKGSIK